MERIICRLLPFGVADGPQNMAKDEVMLHAAVEGTASLRFYGWSPPTLSLGYFQSESVRLGDTFLAALPFVRRPSGGDTLVHDHELTYGLALPPSAPWQSRAATWLARMHGIIAGALREFGISAQFCEPSFSGRPRGGTGANAPPRGRPLNEELLCFHHFTAHDLILEGTKVVGSAQRKHRGALLQHGAILLMRSPHTPSLPGVLELTGRDLSVEGVVESIRREFTKHTGWALVVTGWTDAEVCQANYIADTKYRSDAWNHKR